jgi:putative tryptophan/tyrosine transport system substrate-binding protein
VELFTIIIFTEGFPMAGILKIGIRTSILIGIMLFPQVIVTGVGQAMDKAFTIGVINDVPALSKAIEGFKAGMAELGYVEGKNIKYIYNGLLENNQKIVDAEIKHLLSHDIDIFFTVGNQTALRAKKAVEAMAIPILICAVSKPVESGIIENIRHPGSNITGVAGSNRTSKTLEWLKIIVPGLKKVYLPYNPDDTVSVVSLPDLEEAASQLGIELVLKKVHSIEETVAFIGTLPNNINAIFRIPSPTLDSRNNELSQAAMKRGIPIGSTLPLNDEVLITFATDSFEMGKNTARLANLIHQGIRPADLPVETSEPHLTVNLKTAEKLKLNIPDDVLMQAKRIIS